MLLNFLGYLWTAAPDGDDHGKGHATLTSSSESGCGDVLGSKVQIAVGHDNGVVVRTAEGLDALAMAYAGVLDNVSYWRRTNKRNSVDTRVNQNVLNTAAVPRKHVKDAVGKSGLFVELRGEERSGRRRRCWLKNEGIPSSNGQRVHPHRDHGWEVERADTRDDADWLTGGVDVDSSGHVMRVFAFKGNVDRCREVKGLPTTLDFANRIGVVLAVLLDDEPRHLVLVV